MRLGSRPRSPTPIQRPSLSKTEIIRKRLNKDLPHHPVVMLNFCPDLRMVQPDLGKAHGEFVFLVDRSGSMSAVDISRVKDALLVVLKSPRPACLFNVVGFGSTFKALFPASQTYCEESLAIACESVKRIRADMGAANVFSPLKWVVRQPIHRGHPRLLFLLTRGAAGDTGKVLELLRNHACSTRCYSFGIGREPCRRLVRGLAAVSKGSAEFPAEGERLQPKMIKSLKKAMAPALSDVSVEWVFPESTEVLVSPVSARCLFPGDRLVGYGVVCDTSPYSPNPRADKRRRYSAMRSQESGSSVFFHSQEEGAGAESWSYSRDSEGCCVSEWGGPDHLPVGREPGGDSDTDTGADAKASSRRRAYSANQIADREPFRKAPTASDPGSGVPARIPLRKTHLQDLQRVSPEPWQADAQNPASSCRDADCPPARDGLQHPAPGSGRGPLDAGTGLRSSSESRSPGDPEPAQHPSFAFETETSSDWEPPDGELGSARGSLRCPGASCKAVVKGLRSDEPVQWEVAFDIRPLFRGSREDGDADLWSETFHHLAAKAVIRDFEQLAEKEGEIEHGSGRRYQLNAVHTSKACNVISKYTAFVPVDLSAGTYLPTVVEYPGTASKQGGQRSLGAGSRRHRGVPVGHPRSSCGQNGDDGFYGTGADETSLSPCSTPSSSSWKRCSVPEAPLQTPSAPSVHSQKTLESIFTARLMLNRTRLLTRAARGFMSRSPSRASEAGSESDNESVDYLPLVSLQLACGAFLMNPAFCQAVNIPMEKLKWTSPFACHRLALSPSSAKKASASGDRGSLAYGRQLPVPDGARGQGPSAGDPAPGSAPNGPGGRPRHLSGSAAESVSEAECELWPPAIAIRRFSDPESAVARSGSEAEASAVQALLSDVELRRQTEPEGMLWATAVALAWLENSSASYFIEWELVAAKASLWLGAQDFPDGCSLATVKAAAQQLFVLLRHWDENLEFNLLCYNPSSV